MLNARAELVLLVLSWSPDGLTIRQIVDGVARLETCKERYTIARSVRGLVKRGLVRAEAAGCDGGTMLYFANGGLG